MMDTILDRLAVCLLAAFAVPFAGLVVLVFVTIIPWQLTALVVGVSAIVVGVTWATEGLDLQ